MYTTVTALVHKWYRVMGMHLPTAQAQLSEWWGCCKCLSGPSFPQRHRVACFSIITSFFLVPGVIEDDDNNETDP